ncbi:MAG: dihydrodipicolinate synthase family protein, partial [Planctomycetia bacterium]|nr:dihydrodipicolinate synthase family protein [Planctomycetia bacterium]
IAAGRDDFSVMMGPDRLLGKAIGLGAAGGVNSGSNLCPELFVKMYQAARDGNEQLMAEYQPKIDLIHDLYHTVENGLSVTTGIKTALELLGIGRCCLTKPFAAPAPGEVEIIRDLLSQLI